MATPFEPAPSAPQAETLGKRITLPPPEWTKAAERPGRRISSPPAPLIHKEGEPAVCGTMRARLEAARAMGDLIAERQAALALARWLASAGHGLDEAVALARRVLELEEERTELDGVSAHAFDSTDIRFELASWLEQIGEPGAAADALRGLLAAPGSDPSDAARILVRVGVLHARAGDGRAANAAFLEASNLDPQDAVAAELRGTIATWAPAVLSPSDAAAVYVEAAARRGGAGAPDAQLENLLRAFDIDESSSLAAATLAACLSDRGRAAAADEVWRAHAEALRPVTPARAAAVHARRRLQARAAGDHARALGAALDEGLDAELSGERADAFDEALLRVGLLEPLAARLEVRAERATGAERARILEELGRLLAGPLASPERAASTRVAAVEADPTKEEPLVGLRAHAAATRDATHLVEALIRATAAGAADEDTQLRNARIACARALASLAEDQLGDASLATWAYEGLKRLGARDAGHIQGGLERNHARAETARQSVASLFVDLEQTKDEARIGVLRELAGLLRSMPDDAARHATVLAELAARAPEDKKWRLEAVRVAFRRKDYPEVARFAREQQGQRLSAGEAVQARLNGAAAERALGRLREANEATRDLVLLTPGHRVAMSAAWTNAVLAGDALTRGLSIEQLASSCSVAVRAVMLAVASQVLAGAADPAGARRAAEQACQAEPGNARCVATFADSASRSRDRTSASALERAIGVVCARSRWCVALAEALDELGEGPYAIGWTQRCVSLRPGDREGIAALFRRLARARDAARLADALTWVMSQPQPAGPLGDLVGGALRDLSPLDGDRAAVLARRALDAFGPRQLPLREAMLEVAEATRDGALAAVILERAVAVDFSGDRADALTALVRQRAALGDTEGEVRALARAMREGVRTPELATRMASLSGAGPRLSSDGEVARLEALAIWLAEGPERAAAAFAWRELGAALWDLCYDRVGAVRSWLLAAKTAPSRGYTTLGVDLARFAGARYALDCLSELVAKEPEPVRSGSIAAEAARAALALHEPAQAFELAAIALERNPRHADALEIAERGAVASSREAAMSRLYETLGGRAMGRFGCRAAHYRGARFFEQRGDAGLALKHAALAFCAVPSEGATFLLLKRTADRADDRAEAVRTVVEVADRARSPAVRAGWLLRAAAIASADEEGGRLKLDVLLRAVLLAPDLATLSMLSDATHELLRISPEEREALQVRLGRASATVLSKAEGPEGARIAIAFAKMGLDPFDDPSWAMRAVERAFRCDADLDEYESLVPHVSKLAQASSADETFARIRELTERPYANVGAPALKLLAGLAAARGDGAARARFVVLAAQRDPDDDAIVREADAVVRADPLAVPAATFDRAVPPARRADALRALATEKMREGAFDDAIKALERAAELSDDRQRSDLEAALKAAYEAAGRAEEVEGRALREATSPLASPVSRAARWTEVAQHREAKGDLVGAVDALFAAANLDSGPIERWSALERVAELARLDDVRVSAIREIVQRVTPDAKVAVWKRLARAYEARLDMGAAEATWNSILESDTNDEESDYALESLIASRGDYSDLANHLGKRAERLAVQPGTREALRAVRLRRAAILEQRLERVQDACDELLLVLKESPDNTSAMSYLADLYDRMGEHAQALPLWSRVASLSRDPRAKSDIELRAARTAVAAGQHKEALTFVRLVLEREPGNAEALELAVSTCRTLGDDRGLGDALAELVAISPDGPDKQAVALVEAARAAERAGDLSVAVGRAQSAAALSPGRAETQLYARALEYRSRGPGTPEEARQAAEDLARLPSDLAEGPAALRAYLLAEALDAADDDDGGEGRAVLLAYEARMGPHPLVALGLAERLAADLRHADALPYFQNALLGDVSSVKRRARVALAAADAAARGGEPERAVRLLDEAIDDPTTRAAAWIRKAQLLAASGESTAAREMLAELAVSTEGEDRARALAQLSRVLRASEEAHLRAQANDVLAQAIAAAPEEGGLHAELVAERSGRALGAASETSPRAASVAPSGSAGPGPAGAASSTLRIGAMEPSVDPPGPAALSTMRPAIATLRMEGPTGGPHPPLGPAASLAAGAPPSGPASAESVRLVRTIAASTTPAERSAARLALARTQVERGSEDAAEHCLRDGLAEGGLDEGEMLATLLARHPERSADLVKVRRQLAELCPGDVGKLEMLRRSAILDQNIVYAKAVEHVARAFESGTGPLPPPSLAAQREQPGMLALLTRAPSDRIGQAVALVWDSAYPSLVRSQSRQSEGPALSVRSPSSSSFRVSGTRLMPDNSTVLSRTYEIAIRLLGVSVPVYVRRTSDVLRASVELTYPLAAILSGQVEDTPDLPYVLGQSLAAALPQSALLMGLPPGEAQRVWSAMIGAFGPPELGRTMDAASARLAETFWQVIPARVQRGLQDLLAAARADELPEAVERARQSSRRVGLFLCGDFAVAARALLSETTGRQPTIATADMVSIAARSPAFADLLRLAVSPEYADARWQPVPPAAQRVTMTGGRFRPS